MRSKYLISVLCLSLAFSLANAQIGALESIIGGLSYLYQAYDYSTNNILNAEIKPSIEEQHYQSLKNYLLDLSTELKELRYDIPTLTTIRQRLSDVSKKFADIERFYQNYLNIKQEQPRYKSPDLIEFYKETLNKLPGLLNDIYDYVVGLNDNSLLTLMEHNIEDLDPGCRKSKTRQRYFYDFYTSLLSYMVKSIITIDHAFKVKSDHEAPNKVKVNTWKKTKAEITSVTAEKFKAVLGRTKRDFWKCDPKQAVDKQTYVDLKLFQRVLYRATDFKQSRDADKNRKMCPVRQKRRLEPDCNDCSIKQRHCRNVVDCKVMNYNEPKMVCALKDQTQRRRYSSVNETYKLDLSFTEKIIIQPHCDDKSTNFFIQSYDAITQYDVQVYESCDCICDDTQDSDRYVSLKPVMSDVDRNFVITGVRFVLDKHTLYIQIQQGKLMPHGIIDNTTVGWKDIQRVRHYDLNNLIADKQNQQFNIYDYANHGITDRDSFKFGWYSERGFYLDDMDFLKNEVLTGVTFAVDKKNGSAFVKLDILATQFNYTSGKLYPDRKFWWTQTVDSVDRTELKLDELDTPTSFPFKELQNKPDDVPHQYIKLTPSAYMSKDAGQMTLPFIDIQPVVSKVAVPLTGISLDVKKTEKSGGYLMLKTKSYDVLWDL